MYHCVVKSSVCIVGSDLNISLTPGTLKIHDRQAWQKAIQAGGYDKQCDALTWGGKSMMNTPFESRMMSADQSRDQSRAGSPDRESNRGSGEFFVKRQSNKVRGLACAMLQVSQMLANKYFKPPLGKDISPLNISQF
jgi:hypothetical protein